MVGVKRTEREQMEKITAELKIKQALRLRLTPVTKDDLQPGKR